MITKLTGGRIIDPANQVNRKVCDLYLVDGIVRHTLPDGRKPDREYRIDGTTVMAGAIDMHTHIGGGKVNIARTMMIEDHSEHLHCGNSSLRGGSGYAVPSTFSTGYRYAEMGYTACFEPAVLPVNARQAHMEMADIPMVDKGGYAMLGNDDFLLRLLHDNASQSMINDYVAWTLHAAKCIGIKVVNAGGIHAFKYNVRKLDVDEQGPLYGATPRRILEVLARAVDELGLAHPLHVHASNLGIPGNYHSTLATMDASGGHPMHLTHIQFHSYGTEGDHKFSSAACEIAEAINQNPHITADVGQIMFGQTITTSGDTMRQFDGHQHASPKKWTIMDIECDAGCGVVPFKYRDKSFVNALQWAIGLEIFLQVNDPWRIFLTTDHPNGAPFTCYPHLIKLLMDRSFRNDMLTTLHPEAQKMTRLSTMQREYSLYEIATMTRAAPAKLLGLHNYGHLGDNAIADVVVYETLDDPEKMFSRPRLVFKNGEPVVENGTIVNAVNGKTHIVAPDYDKAIEKHLQRYFDDYQTISFSNFGISDDEMQECIGNQMIVHPTDSRV